MARVTVEDCLDAVENRFEDMVVEREFAKGYGLSPTLKKLKSAPIAERIKAAYDLARVIPYAGMESYAPRSFRRILKERIADDYEKALADGQAAVKLEPRNASAQYNMAGALFNMCSRGDERFEVSARAPPLVRTIQATHT